MKGDQGPQGAAENGIIRPVVSDTGDKEDQSPKGMKGDKGDMAR